MSQAVFDEPWQRAAYDAIKWCAVHHKRFTASDVWVRLQARGVELPESRALGPILQRAAKRGLIVNTGVYRPSRDRRQHGRPVPVWRSLIET